MEITLKQKRIASQRFSFLITFLLFCGASTYGSEKSPIQTELIRMKLEGSKFEPQNLIALGAQGTKAAILHSFESTGETQKEVSGLPKDFQSGMVAYIKKLESPDAVAPLLHILKPLQKSKPLSRDLLQTSLRYILKKGDNSAIKKIESLIKGNETALYDVLFPLHQASKDGDVELIDRILLNGAEDVNSKDHTGSSPLHLAKDIKSAEFLLQQGADPHQKTPRGATTVDLHLSEDRLEIALFLSMWGTEASKGSSRSGKTQSFNLLLDSKTYRRPFSFFKKVIEFIGKENLSHNAKQGSPLHKACESGTVEHIRYLLDCGLDPNATHKGYTPIHSINLIDGNGIDKLEVLKEHGADLTTHNRRGLTVLEQAIKSKKLILPDIIKLGFDQHKRNTKQQSLLHIAASSHSATSSSIIPHLIKKGYSVHAVDSEGLTPLHIAIQKGLQNNVIPLLQAGANLNQPDAKGKTPMDLANKHLIKTLSIFSGNRNRAILAYSYVTETRIDRKNRLSLQLIPIAEEGWKLADPSFSELEEEHTFNATGVFKLQKEVVFESLKKPGVQEKILSNQMVVTVVEPQPELGQRGAIFTQDIRARSIDDPKAKSFNKYDRNFVMLFHGGEQDFELEAISNQDGGDYPDEGPTWSVIPPYVGTFSSRQGKKVTFQYRSLFSSKVEGDILFIASYNGQDKIIKGTSICWGQCGAWEDLPTAQFLYKKDFEGLKRLFKDSGDIGASILSAPMEDGATPLHLAAHHFPIKDRGPYLDLFLDHVKEVDLSAKGWTPLHLSVWADDPETCKKLIAKGADPKKEDLEGRSPLWYAKTFEKKNVMPILNKNEP